MPRVHPGAWRLPDAIPELDVGIEHYVRAAQLAEEATLDAIFFKDQAAVLVVMGNSQTLVVGPRRWMHDACLPRRAPGVSRRRVRRP